MELSLKNYKTALSAELLKKAAKNTVRECDETEKGHFVAYVDEGDDSFDVSLVFTSGNILTSHSCDCVSKVFCQHKTALLLHIAKGSKTKQVIKAKNKTTAAESLLDTVEANELKEWVKLLLIKNKDIELAFTHYFSAKKQQHSPEEVAKLTNDAIKAVIKNKRNIDPTELKKIVDLWTDIHSPIVQNYQANPADENAFLCLHTILECCGSFQQKINTSSNKLTKYIEALLQQSAEAVAGLYEEAAWESATGFFIKHVPDKNMAGIRMHYLLHLKNIINLSPGERKEKLVRRMAGQYKSSYAEQIHSGTQYTHLIFELVLTHDLFADYFTTFKPIRFDNEFNLSLIRVLMDNDNYDLAKNYCQQQIGDNYRDGYNVPYLELLKEIYTVEKDDENLAKVLTELFPHTFHFGDFLFIYNRMQDEEEKKKWRTKMLSKARNDYRNTTVISFCFKLADHEKNYRKMIDYIRPDTAYYIFFPYLEAMILADKTKFLQALIYKSEYQSWSYGYNNDSQKDEACFPEMFDQVVKHYTAGHLKKVVQKSESDRMYSRLNGFLKYAKERLASVSA